MRYKTPIKPGPLPKGAVLIRKPYSLKIGGWVEMVVTARIVVNGLTWYRTSFNDGMETGHYPREDWICDVYGLCLHVVRHYKGKWPKNWNDGNGTCCHTFEKAVKVEVARGYAKAIQKRDEALRELGYISIALTMLKQANEH